MTRDEYVRNQQEKRKILNDTVNYQVVFKCPKCMGDVIKDPYNIIQLTCMPPITKYLCKCTSCDYSEYI